MMKPKAVNIGDRVWKVTVPVTGTVDYEVLVHDEDCDEQSAIETAMSGDFFGKLGQDLTFHWDGVEVQ